MADFCLWIGVLAKKGSKSLEKRIIKVTRQDKTVGDLLMEAVGDSKLIDSVQGFQNDPDKISTASTAITLTMDVPISVMWETFGARFIVAHVRDPAAAEPSSTTPTSSIFDVMMGMPREYKRVTRGLTDSRQKA